MIYKNFCRFRLLIADTMRRLGRFSVFIRFVLWVGIVFLGSIAYAQEKNIDILHGFTPQADTVRLRFDDVLRLSVLYDSADKDDWHYIYRWNTGKRTDAVQVKFEGKRKVLYIGQRLSAIHWPEEYDTFFAAKKNIWYVTEPGEDTCIVCAPTIDAGTYVWHEHKWYGGKLEVLGKKQCIYAYPALSYVKNRPTVYALYCSPNAMLPMETLQDDPRVFLYFDMIRGKKKMQGTAQRHDLNIWDMPRGTQIYARLRDTLHFFFESNPALYPEQEGHEILESSWVLYPGPYKRVQDSSIDIYFKDSIFLRKVESYVSHIGASSIDTYHYLYFGIKPNAQIETDSVWVFFPQYPYSNLGGVVDICWPPDAPLPSADDTV
ncbi:hypothetical protein HDR62_04365, partial [bacterium]|nr:hypothetical protein [bacterium]